MHLMKLAAMILLLFLFTQGNINLCFGQTEDDPPGPASGLFSSSNLAFGKVATQSSTVIGADAARAIDGNSNGNFANGSVTHTDYQAQPWWQVDLGESQQLDYVTIWNRSDCCAERLANFYLFVSDEPFVSTNLNTTLNQSDVSAYYVFSPVGGSIDINVGRYGRFIRVQLAGSNFLSLAEVDVNGVDQEDEANLYTFNMAVSASASSTYPSGNFPVSSIVNGDRKGRGWGAGTGGWNDGTPNQFPDSVEVQLGGEKPIDEVDVFSLQDDLANPAEPTPEMIFSLYGLVDFDVQYWNSAINNWSLIGQVRGNNKVWRQLKFPAVSTSKIKITVYNALSSTSPEKYSRITEVEVWGEDEISLATAPAGPPSQSNPRPCGDKINTPCAPTITLADSINEVTPRYTNYRGWLKWDFSDWVKDDSKNLPLLAHAVTLWRPSAEWNPTNDPRKNAARWWLDYLNCQVGDPACPATMPLKVKDFKSDEPLSNTYDADATNAVVSVYHWAAKRMVKDGDTSETTAQIAFKARRYLEITWGLYVLSAGDGPSRSMINYGNRNLSPAKQGCDQGSGGYWYTGPYLALAGMRSAWGHLCEENRGPLLMRALSPEWPGNLPPGTPTDVKMAIKNRESGAQWLLLDTIQNKRNALAQLPAYQAFAYKNENAYALTPELRDFLVRLIVSGDGSEVIRAFVQGTKLNVEYHFLGWIDSGGREVRMTVMRENTSSATIPTYAVIYRGSDGIGSITGADRTAEAMIPFSTQSIPVQKVYDWQRERPGVDPDRLPERADSMCFRSEACSLAKDYTNACYFSAAELGSKFAKCWTRQERNPGITGGRALLLNNSSETVQDLINPTRVKVTNLAPGEQPHIKHGTIVDWISPLDIRTKLYHIAYIPNTNRNVTGTWEKYW
jgi:F5/8 type C domain